MSKTIILLICALSLSACKPSAEEQAKKEVALEAYKAKQCLNKICGGDKLPKYDPVTEVPFKIGGQIFIGLKEYFSLDGAAFYWPSKTPAFRGGIYPEKGQPFYDVAIEIFLRSTNPATDETTRQLLEKAETQGWIASRTTLRPGLEQVKLRRDPDVPGSMRTLYIATKLKGEDGLAPVALCNNDQVDGRGGVGNGSGNYPYIDVLKTSAANRRLWRGVV